MGNIPKKIILTGGASKSSGIAQTFADVFGVEIYTLKTSQNSAALGAAMRAASCDYDMKFLESKFCPLVRSKMPRTCARQVYAHKLNLFRSTFYTNR